MADHDDVDRKQQLAWKAVSTGAGILGGVATRSLLRRVWTSVGDGEHEPPLNPADRSIGWSTALQWAIGAGVGVGVSRLVSQRLAAAGWQAAVGSPPPGVEPPAS